MADLTVSGSLIASLVSWIVSSIFVYIAARIVVDRSSFMAALVSVFLGSLLAGLVQVGAIQLDLPGWVGMLLSFAAVALVIAVFFRTQWTKGAIIGVVAALLWILVSFLMGKLL